MPQVGDTKTVEKFVSKAELERDITLSNIGGYVVEKAKVLLADALEGAGTALGLSIAQDVYEAGLEERKSELERHLEDVAQNNATGIYVSQEVRYSYIGGGTGWYRNGPADIALYF
ncbi:hypothetical protein [Pontibacillus yanchengensis]|uniref:Uncharacterized protein n=1 Tax=Pontibacillus yanchengensis Y32 TaxID=1385514 RepID=A0A0A2T6C7_9BACI|nr:hypothetical protein [Pontibacillus yanchengensis]KGP71054.1 hypothetical protein N782_01675 [Pontibacillus yanchengensis Y32]KGP71055.1 hypothetical protein N782_01680 [Pontibacillus yanchengensis Y32]